MLKTQTAALDSSRWPAVLGMPPIDSARERSTAPARLARPASLGPIELRITSGDGPSAIAVLE